MSVTIYRASVPVFSRTLKNLSSILNLADIYATRSALDASFLLQARLAPDMLPLVRQVQIASDHAKTGSALLAGDEAPAFADDETSFNQLSVRIFRTIEYISLIAPDGFREAEARSVQVQFGGKE